MELLEDEVLDKVTDLVQNVKTIRGQVKNLEGLKKYNQDLRREVISKTSEVHAIKLALQHCDTMEELCILKKRFQITEAQNDADGGVEVSVTKGPEEVIKQPLHPLELPELLEMVLKNLNQKEVHNSRLVSKGWNEAAIKVIVKHHPPYIYMLEDAEDQYFEILIDILRTSDSPEVIVQRMLTKPSCLMLPNFQTLLIEYGHLVKAMLIEDCSIRPSLMKSLLFHWCTKLLELEIESLNVLEEEDITDDKNSKANELSSVTTNLQRLTFDTVHVPGSNVERNAKMLLDIAIASPCLMYLRNEGPDALAVQFFRGLQDHPEVSSKIKELCIHAGYNAVNQPLQFCLDIVFGTRLTRLNIDWTVNVRKHDLLTLLHKLSSSLTWLSLCRKDNAGSESNVILETGFPKMPYLTVFKYFAHDWSNLQCKNVKENFPKLNKLIVTGNYDYFETLSRGHIDEMFTESTTTVPHLKLETLCLLGEINKDTTTTRMNQAFPKLRKLYLSLDFEGIECTADAYGRQNAKLPLQAEEWFENTFAGISKMVNLSSLYVNFEAYEWPHNVNLQKSFAKLREMPLLRILTLINGDASVPPTNLITSLRALLEDGTRLSRLDLSNFTMKLEDAHAFLRMTVGLRPELKTEIILTGRKTVAEHAVWIIDDF